MGIFLSLHFLLLAFFVGAEEKYTSKFDNVDYEEILRSDRLLNNYVNCLLDEAPCTPDGNELKRILPDALLTDCSKCSDRQKAGAKRIIGFLKQNKRESWDLLIAKYDPDGTFRKKHQEEWEME